MGGTVRTALQSRATYQEGRYSIHFDKNFVFATSKLTVGQKSEPRETAPIAGSTSIEYAGAVPRFYYANAR